MAILKVARLGHPILRQQAEPVSPEAIPAPDIQHLDLVKDREGGLERLAAELTELKKSGPGALSAYVRNVRLALYADATQVFVEMRE